MKITRSVFLLFTIALIPPVQAEEATPLTRQYMKVFSDRTSTQAELEALNQLQWAGLSDPRLYDLVERNLLDLYPSASGKALDLVSWYAKSLGTSGLDKYRTTLQGIIDSDAHKKVRKYAGEGLDNIGRYARWNPIIADRTHWERGKSEKINGFANMLRSDDWTLQNMAAKRIYADSVHDPFLLDVLEQRILADYQTEFSDKYRIQTLGWMVRALASSGLGKYRSTIEAVADNAGSQKVRGYGRKYLKEVS